MLSKYPAALALMARHYSLSTLEGARRGYRAARGELGEAVPPHAVDAVLGATARKGSGCGIRPVLSRRRYLGRAGPVMLRSSRGREAVQDLGIKFHLGPEVMKGVSAPVAIVFDVTAVESGTRGPTGTFGYAPAATPIDAATAVKDP